MKHVIARLAASLWLGALALLGSIVPAGAKTLTIALIPGLTTDPFYITMHTGAEAAAKTFGVHLLFQGAPQWSTALQVPVLDAVIARHPDAILIAPTDAHELVEPLRKAVAAGIPVITVDLYIGNGHYQTGSGDADFPLSFIASDNFLGGEIAADALAHAIGGKGKVYVSSVEPGISAADQREQGFKTEMKAHFPQITVLATEFNNDDANTAASQLQATLARNPDLVGVFGANLFSALGAANGVKAAGELGKIKVVAFDAPPAIVGDLKSGLVSIAIAQHPAEIGWFGVAAALAHLEGQSIPTAIHTGFTVITPQNVDDPNVKKFIYHN